MLVILLRLLSLVVMCTTIQGLECLLSNGQNYNMPLMQRDYMGGNRSVIPRGYQALIPSYRFDCSGNITEWLVGLTSPTVELIEIELQVWRPVNRDSGPPCFKKIGSNTFTVPSMVQVANFTPTEQINFQSGDVVGFHLLSFSQQPTASSVTEENDNRHDRSDDERDDGDDDLFEQGRDKEESEDGDGDDDDDDGGVVILNEVNNISPNEEVWFSRIDNTMLGRNRNFDGCDLSIGSSGMLTIFTNAAPLISASVLVIEDNLQVQRVTIRPSTLELSPITVEEELILVSATIAPAMLIMLVSIVLAVACTWCLVRRRRNKLLKHNRSISASNEDTAEQRTVVPIVYRRETTQNTTAEPGTVRVALIPPASARQSRTQRGNRSAEITRENQSIVRASEVNLAALNGSKNKLIIMKRNESYGKLETIADSDAEYYFMYDYPYV